MSTNETAPTESPAKESLLPGTLSGLAMVAIAAIQVIGMLFYNHSFGGTAMMLAVGGFVYLATMGYQKWKAGCPSAS